MDKNHKLFCLYCDVVIKHECKMTHNRLQFINLKRTRWRRFMDKVISLDITWGFAFMGLVVMNCILMRHINLTLTEAFVESLSLGFAIPRLLK